ncbi:MAG: serine hydrolase [Patescibacteria group bacterium]
MRDDFKTKYFVHALFCLLAVSVLIFSLLIMGGKSFKKGGVAQAVETSNPFQEISLEAKGAVVWDVINRRELFSKNSNEPLPLASLTKVLTVIMTSEKINDDQKIKITPADLGPEGDSKLAVGDIWRAKDLRDFTLLTSSNDGAFALAAVTETHPQFIKEMNDIASKIGLSSSRFFNEHGLDREADRGGAYGSAKDMAILFEYALKNYPEVLEATRYKNLEFSSSQKKYSAENTNTAIDKIPNIIASKTGFTDLAGGNLVVAFDAGLNRPIIISVLGSGEQGRFSDMLQLVEASIKYINND